MMINTGSKADILRSKINIIRHNSENNDEIGAFAAIIHPTWQSELNPYFCDLKINQMATTADIRNGLCIEWNHDIFQFIEFQHVKPGKGNAFVRCRMKSFKTGRVLGAYFPVRA
jgi:hypothetical protein